MTVMFRMNITTFLGNGLIELYNSVWHAITVNKLESRSSAAAG